MHVSKFATTGLTAKELVTEAIKVHKKYSDFYGPALIQGVELLIAEEIANRLHARVISGIMHTETGPRSHYWCVKNNVVLDPVFYMVRIDDSRAWKEETDGGEHELRNNIERYRNYQI